MTGLPENIEELLTELVEKSRHEMNIMLALADAIRRTDEQLLREVQSVTMSHEMRRAEIRSELQALSTRLCALPTRPAGERGAETLQRPQQAIGSASRSDTRNNWSTAAQEIDAELTEAFGAEPARH